MAEKNKNNKDSQTGQVTHKKNIFKNKYIYLTYPNQTIFKSSLQKSIIQMWNKIFRF
jgi:hypothetical protein